MIEIREGEILVKGIRFSIYVDGDEAGRATLYILKNSLHHRPFGFVEDVYVAQDQRGNGFATMLMNTISERVQSEDCYKAILTTRFGKDDVREWYNKLGYRTYGYELRMNL